MVLAAAAFVPFYDSLLIFNSWWNGKKDFKSLAWSSVSTRLVSVAVTALTVIATNNVILILLTYFTVNTLMRWVFFCRVKTESVSGGAAETVKASTLSYGKHLSFMGILSTIAVYIDKVLVFHYLGAANLAVYTFATIIPDQVRNVLRNISTLALPKFAARSVADIKKTLGPRMAKMAILIGAIVTAYIVSAPYIFRILFPNYLESVIYSQAAAIGLLAYVAVVPLTVMQAKQATKGLYWHTTITSVIKILLLLAIVPVYGIWGAVISLIIYQFVALIPPIIYLKNQP
jgi:O-antigen/teichoic acid export membrane protein